MKRLIKTSRLKRKIIAEWTPVDISSPDLVQTITDAMAAATQIQIEYQGSGWRLIQPYGWNTSKAGNILLMCYKDTGEVRSYRLDRINEVLIDDSLIANQPAGNLNSDELYEVKDYEVNPEDYEIPPLPNMDEILEQSENEVGQKLPFDEGLDYLTNNEFENTDELNKDELNEDELEEEKKPA